MTPEEREDLEAQGFIIHTDTRMHLPELTDCCVDCMREQRDEARSFAEATSIHIGPFPWDQLES